MAGFVEIAISEAHRRKGLVYNNTGHVCGINCNCGRSDALEAPLPLRAGPLVAPNRNSRMGVPPSGVRLTRNEQRGDLEMLPLPSCVNTIIRNARNAKAEGSNADANAGGFLYSGRGPVERGGRFASGQTDEQRYWEPVEQTPEPDDNILRDVSLAELVAELRARLRSGSPLRKAGEAPDTDSEQMLTMPDDSMVDADRQSKSATLKRMGIMSVP